MCNLHSVAALVLVASLGIGCSKNEVATATVSGAPSPAPGASVANIEVTSTSFAPNAPIPPKYTCEGEETSPAIAWSALPAGTKSVAVIVEDPDAPDPAAPKHVFVHWILYDLPPTVKELADGAKSAAAVGEGARDGKNDDGRTGWKGPCPPKGRHRYFTKVYALDTVLPDLGQPTKAALERAMSGHVIGKGELIGTYEKQPR